MAGIGFKIGKILAEDTFTASLRAHFYSVIISSGPWLLSILTIFCLNYFRPKSIDIFEAMYFRTTVIYIFAFSLIITGLFYLSLSRYLADKLYQKDPEALLPAFNSAALLLLAIQAVTGYFFFSGSMEAPIVLLSVLLYMAMSLLWLIMIFLTALRDYKSIAVAYAAGAAVAIAASLLFGSVTGLVGYFAGYLLGHLVIVMLLSLRIFTEFNSKRIFDRDLFTFMLRNKKLVFIGIFYNTAIWIDKMVFWASDRAICVTPFLRSYPLYDSAVFFAYITIIPAISIFLIHVETDFYKAYRGFYTEILGKGTYGAIKSAHQGMSESLKKSIFLLITCQGLITLIAVTFAPEFAGVLGLKSMAIPIFRITTMGAFLHSLLLVAIIVILYFDFQNLAVLVTAVFLVTNCLFTLATVNLSIYFLGYGYFFSALFSLAIAFYAFNFKLNRVEYLTFAMQPLGIHREEEIV